MKAKFLEYWDENRYQFKYYPEHYKEETFDFEGLSSTLETYKQYTVGDSVPFGKLEMKAVGKSNRYLIVYDENTLVYSVIDLDSGLCGITDRTFNFTNFNNPYAVEELLNELDSGNIKLSYRSSVPLTLIK